MTRRLNWQTIWDMFKESTWITMLWEWFQTLLGRMVDFILWVTMIFSGYQLIPGAPQPSQGVSNFMFILQFVALDVGGLGLNQLGQRHGLGRWSFARVVAYILIGITLVTITYAGIHHAIPNIPTAWNNAVEVALVVARAVMTVFYGQAMKSFHVVEQTTRDRIASLEAETTARRDEVSTLQQRLSTAQQEVSTLRHHLDSASVQMDGLRGQLQEREQTVSTLRSHLDTHQQTVSTLQQQVDGGQDELTSVRQQLSSILQERDHLHGQLDSREQAVSTLQQHLSSVQEELSILRVHLDSGQTKVDAEQVDSEKKTMSSGQAKVDTGQVDRENERRGNVVLLQSRVHKQGHERMDTLAEQIKALHDAEPGLTDRAIALRLSCSPTTVGKWRKTLGRASQECVNS